MNAAAAPVVRRPAHRLPALANEGAAGLLAIEAARQTCERTGRLESQASRWPGLTMSRHAFCVAARRRVGQVLVIEGMHVR